MSLEKAEIAIVMASKHDLRVMMQAAAILDRFGVQYHIEIISTHRSPDRMVEFSKTAQAKGFKVVIAGAGGAAHLPGMIAAYTPLPVIGVPIKTETSIDGLDAIYSMLQMPNGVPVATMALDNAPNAAIFALQILGCSHPSYLELVNAFKTKQKQDADRTSQMMQEQGYEKFAESLGISM
jgi:5-(carboxyamino)imidazole ribonucleotide mutase